MTAKKPPRKTTEMKDGDPARPVAPIKFRLGYLVHDVSRMRRTVYDQHLKPLGITRSQWWVLASISRYPERGVTSSTLARDMDVGKVTLHGIIDRLEVAGYIYRRGDKSDKRAKQIFITESGYQLISEMQRVIEPLHKQISEGLSAEDLVTTEAALETLKANLRRLLGEAEAPGADDLTAPD